MAVANIFRLIAEAQVLAGGKHPCEALGHVWKSTGGRACPFGVDGQGCSSSSQAVHECTACGAIDYGDTPGEPGYDFCASQGFDCDNGHG